MTGVARLRVAANPGSKVNVGDVLHLDVHNLTINTVVDDKGTAMPFEVKEFTGFGSDLVVDTSAWGARDEAAGSREFGLVITYQVDAESALRTATAPHLRAAFRCACACALP